MNYWHMQLHPDDKSEWSSSDIRKILDRKILGCSGPPLSTFQTIKVGDYILVRHGGEVLAMTRVKSNPQVTPEELKDEYIWFDNYCEIEVLENYHNERISGKGWFIPKTLMPIDNAVATKYFKNLLMKINVKMKIKSLQDNINLLKYKKQIILQGPPGTGKTRLAKEIANLILNENPEDLAPIQLIENFFKSGISDSNYNFKFKERLTEFQEAFPKDQLANLELDDYCIGKGNNTNFCWWIEVGLKEYGRFSPGNSGNYTIYFSKSQDDYVLTKMEGSPKDVLPQLANALQDLAEKENIEEAEKFFGYSFIIKILNSYHPEKYFPINGRDSLINLMKLFGEDFKKIGTIDLNKKIQQIFVDYKNRFPSNITNLDFMKFLYSRFDLNNDGNLYDKTTEVISKRKSTIIQFHPSYTYEDFVRGIVAESKGNNIEYKSVNKIIGKLANEASENPYADYVLIIDEINRANLSSVLGELIYALEYRKEIVMSPYGIKDDNNDEKENNELSLPPNLYIIGTMNTADRSVGHIDYAIRRRFAFVDVLPNMDPVHPLLEQKFIEISGLFVKDFTRDIKSKEIENAETLASEFRAQDVWIGHSYFICKNDDGTDKEESIAQPILNMKMQYEIIPILEEYVKDGILLSSVKIESLKMTVVDYIKSLKTE